MPFWMILLGIVLFAAVIGAGFWMSFRLRQGLRFLLPNISIWVFLSVFAVMSPVMILGIVSSVVTLPAWLKNSVGVISAYWMGIFIHLAMFFLLSELAVALGSLTKWISRPVKPAVRFWAVTLALVLALGTSCYGFLHAVDIRVAHYDITTEKDMEGELDIVLVTDLHLGAAGSEARLERIVDRINQQQPDLVCIAGDIFDNDFRNIRDPQAAAELLRRIDAAYGVWACLGNHDSGKTLGMMLEFLEESNISILNDEYTVVDDRVVLVGRLDAFPIAGFGELWRQELDEILPESERSLPVVVMDHNPQHVDTYGSDTDLILCGHAHKGQLFPARLVTMLKFPVDYGYYQNAAGAQAVVSSGAGTWGMPMRTGSDCEIVTIRLHG